MDIKSLLGIAAAVLAIVCFVPYFRDIFKGKTTPHAYSWLVWSMLQLVGVVAIISNGGGYYGASGIAIGALCCVAIFSLSFKYGTKNITKSDAISLVAALSAILLLVFTSDALYSVILITIIDIIGFIPTVRKGYEEPFSETTLTYLIASLSNVCAVGALTHYSLTTVLYLVSLIFTNGLFVIVLYIRRKQK